MTLSHLSRHAMLAVGMLLLVAGILAIRPGGSLAATMIEGVITDSAGAPIQGAIISDGENTVVTGTDGLFTLSVEGPSPTVLVRAAGYVDWHDAIDAGTTSRLAIVLETQQIRALYFNPQYSAAQEDVDRIIEVIDSTSANAVVIDIKEEWVWYDTSVEFFRDAGSVAPLVDLPNLLAQFEEHGIYTIARLVLFKDSIVAEAFPDLAIKHIGTDQPWRDQNGVAWVNPMNEDLWQPNIDLAVEAANLGFDEIQYDYVRFPTDGDLTTMDFGTEFTQAARQEAIEGFLAQSREALLPTGARQSADIFGFALVVTDDVGIGQNLVNLEGVVDYLSPMLYPSHYSDYQFGLPGHPNDYPYDIVAISLETGISQLGNNSLIFRPWLQDFDREGMRSYTAFDVREQIRAADEYGTSGWMLWDPAQLWRVDRLDPAENSIPGEEHRVWARAEEPAKRRQTPENQE